jgi:hypothetical protein
LFEGSDEPEMRVQGLAGLLLTVVAACAEEFIRRRGMGPLNGAIGFGMAGTGACAVLGSVQGGAYVVVVGAFVGLVVGATVGLIFGTLWQLGRKAAEVHRGH